MKSFKQIIFEADIDSFMSKISACQTVDGLRELEKYYNTRVKEVEVNSSDDISMRDALKGRHEELKAASAEDVEKF